jgi:hypothetical protein
MDEERDRQRDMEVEDTRQRSVEDERRMPERTSERRASTEMDRDELAPLFEGDAAEKFRTRWLAIQSKFVDDPSASVKDADDLVADVIQNITSNFADRRGSLERQWSGGGNTSTEDLRIALKQYRSFFERLLTLQS